MTFLNVNRGKNVGNNKNLSTEMNHSFNLIFCIAYHGQVIFIFMIRLKTARNIGFNFICSTFDYSIMSWRL